MVERLSAMEASQTVNLEVANGSEQDARPEAVETLRQIAELAVRLADELGPRQGSQYQDSFDQTPIERTAFNFEAPAHRFKVHGDGDMTTRLIRSPRPPLPDPMLVRRIIRQRQLRARFFDGDLFADPAWDMLLDLTAARVEHTRVSVTSLCLASGVPPTTALRWVSQMTGAGLLTRVEDEADRRRAFITLTDKAVEAMARYFHEIGKLAARLV